MSLFDSILSFLKKENKSTNAAPEGFCPNCWGRQEYSSQFYDAMETQNISVNNFSDKKGWVQDYADKHLSGIALKQEVEGQVCSKCKVTYRPS